MADTQNPPTTLKGAFMSLNPKTSLAFFLVALAALLVVFLTIVLVKASSDGKSSLDAGTIALLAGMVTTFILMAKTASDYQFTSSAGSDKKDDAQTAVSKALADKVPAAVAPPIVPPPPTPIPPTVVVAWWSALTPDEQAAIEAAGAIDPKVKAFADAAKVGKATPEDLAYLVSKIPPLLTQDRATALASI